IIVHLDGFGGNLVVTIYKESRNRGRGLFFDASRLRIGRQSIHNRLGHVAQIREPWNELGQKLKVTRDVIRSQSLE
ncbi:hypothetical protein QPL65_24975, partial [Escherichia coli]|uniref:hypothetical protein n=1 Tax=Escherichia coli TaxID=562 RepID=UPI00270609A7